MTRELAGAPVADAIRADVREAVDALRDAGTVPTLGTVLASDAAADARFMALKHEACADLGIDTRDVRLDGDAPESAVCEAVTDLVEDPAVDACFVQTPLPSHVDELAVRERVDPSMDVDAFNPTTLGRLVGGDPTFVPATTAAVCRLLAHYDVPVTGRDVTVVGRSSVIGRPLAARLLHDADPGNATVTVCHSATADLGTHTRRADVVVTAAGEPGLVDGSMLAADATVLDVSANRVAADTDRGYRVVGDVDAESARERVAAITPVPGGVGPVTLATLCANVVRAAGGDPAASDAR